MLQKVLVFNAFLKGSGGALVRQPGEQPSEKGRFSIDFRGLEEAWSRKTLYGKCDGYMRGLDGA